MITVFRRPVSPVPSSAISAFVPDGGTYPLGTFLWSKEKGSDFFVLSPYFVLAMPQSWRSGRRDLPAKDPGGPPAKFFAPRKEKKTLLN